MNIKKTITSALLGLVVSSCAIAQKKKIDFNLVGKEMSKMLMNRHYEQIPFDKALSEKIFKLFIQELDRQKVYLTQADIAKLKENYGDNVHERLILLKSTEMAEACHDLYVARVKQRIQFAQNYLKNTEFTFTSNQMVERSNKLKVAEKNFFQGYAKDDAAAEAMWKRLVEDAVLSETLRRENIARLAKEQGKENPLKGDKPIKKIIHLRYQRMLKAILDEDNEDVANYLLSSVAKAYGPHTDYYSAREYDRFKASMDNKFVGIGAMLQAEDDGATKITGIVVGGPAAQGGELQLNDRIVGVDHLNTGEITDIMFMKINKVVELIRGPVGSTVALKVQTAAGEAKIIKIKRGDIEMNDEFATGQIVESKNADGTIRKLGILKLPAFYINFQTGENRCSDHVKMILKRMVKENIDGLLFDLRGNGGGSLEEVRIMTGFFTGRGPVVQEKDHLGKVSLQSAFFKPLYDGPMVCMIDKSSASASEILAGALQDYNRAVIIGSSSSFGKGTVQQAMSIANQLPLRAVARDRAGFLKPTIRKFYRVAGSSTQNKGVESDIVLPNILDALELGEKYLDFALPHDVIAPAAGFNPLDRNKLFIAKLKANSAKRVNANRDFQYLSDDIRRTKEKIAKNATSLNKQERLNEIAISDKRTKERNAERIKRFKVIQDTDKATLTFKRLNREDVDKEQLKEFDPSVKDETYMKMAKNKEEDLDETPEWPSRIDATKREGMSILNDLITLTQKDKVAVGGR